MLLGDVRTGEVTRVFRDESTTWVDVDDVRWIDEGRSFLWMSERDGWQHVYRVTGENGDAALVTRFEADVTDLVGVDEPGGWLYVLASPEHAGQR